MGEDVSLALDDLVAGAERPTGAVASSEWRDEIEDIRGSLVVQLGVLSSTDEWFPHLASDVSFQIGRTRFIRTALERLTSLLAQARPP